MSEEVRLWSLYDSEVTRGGDGWRTNQPHREQNGLSGMNDCGANQAIGRMTHLLARRDAFPREADESIGKSNVRACSACDKDFLVMRPWQRQCSPRCRQRTYVQRQSETPMGYYGA